ELFLLVLAHFEHIQFKSNLFKSSVVILAQVRGGVKRGGAFVPVAGGVGSRKPHGTRSPGRAERTGYAWRGGGCLMSAGYSMSEMRLCLECIIAAEVRVIQGFIQDDGLLQQPFGFSQVAQDALR